MSLLTRALDKLLQKSMGFGLQDVAKWRRLQGSNTWAGKSVTETNALELSAWWRGVKLHAEVTGALPLKFYERTGDDRKQVRDHPVASIIGLDPNTDQTTQEFWGGQASGLVVFGNAYAEKRFIGPRLVSLEQLPYETLPKRNKDGDLEYHYSDRGKAEKPLPADKVFHTKGFGFGGDLGLSPLSFARQTLSITLATEEAAGKTFSHGMRASGFFTGPMSKQEQRDQFTKTFIDPIIGNNAEAHYGILPPQFDFKTINIPPKDAEMLLSRRFNVEELARFMGMPPILLGHSAEGQTMWGTGVESIVNQWLILGYDAFLNCIEKSINKRLLKPAERVKYFAEFDRDALMRIDSAARGAFISQMIQNAQMTPNEGRRKANRPAMEGGDQLLVNSTLTPLLQLGQKPPARIQPAPGEPIPENTP